METSSARARPTRAIAALALASAAALASAQRDAEAPWSPAEIAALRALWIGSLPPLPADPSNRVADDERAAVLGQRLFFDTRLSGNGSVACATCHLPARQFQDGTPLGKGIGTTTRRTMSIVGAAYSPWLFWDGRKDSLWSQALGPLESAVEHGGDRALYAHVVAGGYRTQYEAVFGALPDLARVPERAGPFAEGAPAAAWQALAERDRQAVNRVFANVGKAIAAYERRLLPGESRFDRYAAAVLRGDRGAMRTLFTADEAAGLRLFIGKARCTQCHDGPLLTNNDFHNTGVPASPSLPADDGRRSGVSQVRADEFNCLGPYSDARPNQCGELNFLVAEDATLLGRFRPPSLRNVARRAPYMHAGQFTTLQAVIDHYDHAPAAPRGESELHPLGLDAAQKRQLVAFLATLDGPVAAEPRWLRAPGARLGRY